MLFGLLLLLVTIAAGQQPEFCYCGCQSTSFCSVFDQDDIIPCDNSVTGRCWQRGEAYLGQNNFTSLRDAEFKLQTDLCRSDLTCCPTGVFTPTFFGTFDVQFTGVQCNDGAGGDETLTMTATSETAARGNLAGGALVTLLLSRPGEIDFSNLGAAQWNPPTCCSECRSGTTLYASTDCTGPVLSLISGRRSSCPAPVVGTCVASSFRGAQSERRDQNVYLNTSATFLSGNYVRSSGCSASLGFNCDGTTAETQTIEVSLLGQCYNSPNFLDTVSYIVYCASGLTTYRAFQGEACTGAASDYVIASSMTCDRPTYSFAEDSGTLLTRCAVHECNGELAPPPLPTTVTPITTAPAAASNLAPVLGSLVLALVVFMLF